MKSRGLFSIVILGIGNAVGTLTSAIALILFSRFMGPSEFGLFSAAFATLLLAVRISDMGINIASERSIARISVQGIADADRLMRVTFWLKAAMSLSVSLIGWLISPWLGASVLHFTNYSIIRMAFAMACGTVFFEYTSVIYQSTQRFKSVAEITILQGFGKLFLGLLLIWQKSLSAASALFIYGIMPFLGALFAWRLKPLTSFALPRDWRTHIFPILNVAKWTSVAAVSATLADNLDILMVQSFLTSYDTGLWSAAAKIAAFASILGLTIGSVLNNRVAQYREQKDLNQYLSKAWKMAVGAFILTCLTIPLSGIAVRFTAGEAYMGAVPALKYLLFSAALTTATAPYSALFYLFDKPRYYAYAGFLLSALLIVGDLFFIPRFGIDGAAWIRASVRGIILVFTLVYAYAAYHSHFNKIRLSEL